MMKDPTTIDRQWLIEQIRKWGDVNSDGLLDPSCQVFALENGDGFIGYKEGNSHCVVFGDPVCAPEQKANFAQAFQDHCESKKLGTVYTMVSPEFADWASQNLSAISIEFAQNFVFNPQQCQLEHTGSNAQLVRKKVKHAVKDGAVVKEYLGTDPKIEQGIDSVANQWLNKRHGPQVYLCGVDLFHNRQGKRYFYATKGDEFVGLVILNAIQGKNGWLLNNLMVTKTAPTGLSELLVVTALQTVAAEQCSYVTVGPLVGLQLGKITGMGKIKSTCARWTFNVLKSMFHLDGQRTFWSKFHYNPEGCFLLFNKKNLGVKSIKDVMKAFNVGKK